MQMKGWCKGHARVAIGLRPLKFILTLYWDEELYAKLHLLQKNIYFIEPQLY